MWYVLLGKSILSFLKENWLVILAIIGGIVILFQVFRMIDGVGSDTSALEKKIQEQNDRHVNDLAEMSRIMAEQRERQAAIETEFREKVEELNRKYEQKLVTVNRNQQANQKRLVENPTRMSEEFRNVFGIRSFQP